MQYKTQVIGDFQIMALPHTNLGKEDNDQYQLNNFHTTERIFLKMYEMGQKSNINIITRLTLTPPKMTCQKVLTHTSEIGKNILKHYILGRKLFQEFIFQYYCIVT